MTVHAKARVSLNLPKSLKAAAEDFPECEGVSLNRFVAPALAEKVGAARRGRRLGWREERSEGHPAAWRRNGRARRPKDRESGRPVDGRAIRLPGGASRRARGHPLFCASGNRGAAAWAGAETRLPGAGRRGPICRGTNRAGNNKELEL